MVLLGLLVAAALSHARLAAQEPSPDASSRRAEDARQQGAEKRLPAGLDPLRERAEAALDRLHARDVYPEVGSIVSGSGLAVGTSLRTSAFGSTRVGGELGVEWSVRGYSRYTGRVGLVERADDTSQLGPADENLTSLVGDDTSTRPGFAAFVDARVTNAPRVDYFGLGAVGPGTRTDVGLSTRTLDLVTQWQPTSSLGFAARAGVLDVALAPGSNADLVNLEDRFDATGAPGLHDDTAWLTAGLLLTLDTRDHARTPTTGSFVGLTLWRFAPTGRDAAPFTRVALDGRLFRSMRSPRHVLAMRVLASLDSSAAASPTPFYLQYWLGGSHTLRGFRSYRFRGEALVHVSTEYRWRVADMVELAPFVDAGTVADDAGHLALSAVQLSPGVGVRLRSDDRVFLRVDWSRGSAGHRVLWSLSPPF